MERTHNPFRVFHNYVSLGSLKKHGFPPPNQSQRAIHNARDVVVISACAPHYQQLPNWISPEWILLFAPSFRCLVCLGFKSKRCPILSSHRIGWLEWDSNVLTGFWVLRKRIFQEDTQRLLSMKMTWSHSDGCKRTGNIEQRSISEGFLQDAKHQLSGFMKQDAETKKAAWLARQKELLKMFWNHTRFLWKGRFLVFNWLVKRSRYSEYMDAADTQWVHLFRLI